MNNNYNFQELINNIGKAIEIRGIKIKLFILEKQNEILMKINKEFNEYNEQLSTDNKILMNINNNCEQRKTLYLNLYKILAFENIETNKENIKYHNENIELKLENKILK